MPDQPKSTVDQKVKIKDEESGDAEAVAAAESCESEDKAADVTLVHPGRSTKEDERR